MSRDPWADDWEDDWTKAAQTKATSSEIWSQANSRTTSTADIQKLAPQVSYKPQIRILKRDASLSNSAHDVNLEKMRANQVDNSKASREERYKEARERLFGASGTSSLTETVERKSDRAPRTAERSQPARQARGPQEAGSAGFTGRGHR